MTRLVLGTLVLSAVALSGCHEGLEDTVWDDDSGTRTLTFWDTGATWEERSVQLLKGERVIEDGLRYEGVFTETDEGADVDVRCVSAENGAIATPCDVKSPLEMTCVIAPDDAAALSCKIGEAEVLLHHRGVRKVKVE